MFVRIVVPFRGFKIEDDISVKFNDFTLTNSLTDKNIVLSPSFMRQFGEVSRKGIMDNYVFLFAGDSKELEVIKHCTDFLEIGKIVSKVLAAWCNALWFIKDNGCFVPNCYVELWGRTEGNKIEGIDGSMILGNTFISNSQGITSPVIFTAAEIGQWVQYVDTIFKYNVINEKHLKLLPKFDHNNLSIIPNVANYVPYDIDRISRALGFLQLLRSKSNLIMKITFHIAIYESLFTSGSSEVTHQVSERASLYLGGTSDEKKANYLLLKNAYAIRSNFVHGNKVKGGREDYLKIALPLDELTRKLFRKVLKYPEIFQSSEDNQKEFNEYFYNLIFSQESK